MLSPRKFLIPSAIGAALALAACGSSSSHPASSAVAAAPAQSGSSSAGKALTLSTAHGSAGVYLTGASGRSVYLWEADHGGKSSCSGTCAQYWPPVTAGSVPHAGGGVRAADLSLVSRPGGGKQVVYDGHPLYYYVGDTQSGSTAGEGNDGFGAKWWLVAPAGRAITTGSAGASGGSSSASSSAGGSGYSSGGSGY